MPKPADPSYVIVRFGFDLPRLIEVTSECDRARQLHGRDVLRGGRVMVRRDHVIARHRDEEAALASYRALKAALPELDASITRARAAYDRAVRQRLKTQTLIAEGRVKA